MKRFLLAAFLISACANAFAGGLTCKQVRTDGELLFHIENEKGEHLGEKDVSGYFEDKKECESILSRSKNGLVCAWNKKAWSLFSERTMKFVDSFSSLEDCTLSTWYSTPKTYCAKQKANDPWSISNGTAYLQKTFESVEECGTYSSSSNTGYVCLLAADTQFYIHNVSTAEMATSIRFSDFKSCTSAISGFNEQKILTAINSPLDNLIKPFGKDYNNDVGFGLAKCTSPEHNYHLVKLADGKFSKACLPDTYYSWGDSAKIDYYAKNMGEGKWIQSFERPLYSTQSPVGTFAYGNVSMRIKIKPSAKVKYIDYSQTNEYKACGHLNEKEHKDTFLLVYWKNGYFSGMDYIFCSSGPIESWSYGTREHYDEIVRDYNWVQSHNYKQYELYYKNMSGQDLFIGSNVDGHAFTANTLRANLAFHRQMADLKTGKIFFAPGVDKNPASHFSTSKPMYYNW